MNKALAERFSSEHKINPALGYDSSSLRGKTIIITGGASGIGEASLRGFVKSGAFVAFSDISKERGDALASELGSDKVVFVQGDVMNWADQKRLFKTAVERSPSGSINIVFANAAFVKGPDEIHQDILDDNGELAEPNIDVAVVHFRGTIFTAKLALHYFRRRLPKGDSDHCLIMTSSIAAYWDHPGHAQYAMGKWAVRGLMRSLRASVPETEMRVNIMAPWFLRTNLVSKAEWDSLEERRGIIFAETEDAASAVLHVASDQSIHGRSVMVVPRDSVSQGYVDANRDGHDVETIGRERYTSKKAVK